jgi:transketolase
MRKTSLDCVFELAKKDKRVLFIGSDLGPGVLENFKKELPSQFFMEGIAEQFIIGMSAGLAKEGFIPYVNTIATFITRRCYEQVAIDLCLHDLPVRLIGNGGGLVYAPLGPTHLALEDISLMKSLPNMTIISPCDAKEMHAMMHQTLNYMHFFCIARRNNCHIWQ